MQLSRMVLFLFVLFLMLLILLPNGLMWAQDASPAGPIYIVQDGDSLWSIATRFRVGVDVLAELNNITNPNQLIVGTQLEIPGLEGIQGILTTVDVPFGETLRSLSRHYKIDSRAIARLNHYISPMELYAGSTLIIPQSANNEVVNRRITIEEGQSLIEVAALNNQNPWKVMLDNNIDYRWQTSPVDPLVVPGDGVRGLGGFPEIIRDVTISPIVSLQGKTTVFHIFTDVDMDISGSFLGHKIIFFPLEKGHYVALQGIHAMTNAGIYPLRLDIDRPDKQTFAYSQMINVQVVDYPYDRPLTVDELTIDPAITKPEDEKWFNLVSGATPERFWSGSFIMPTPLPLEYCLETNDCWSSRFGNRRSYNGSAYRYFHTGLDILGNTGTEIYAPADGVVVFAGELTIRGNATLIDHGWGVYTGYAHQSEMYVKAGDSVETGQLIGLVGDTGRVEGAHLHWEVLVGGVQVDPLDWLSTVYP